MLTQTLRGLERDGLVSRTVHPVVPPRVDYALTALGRSLLGLVSALETGPRSTSATCPGARRLRRPRHGHRRPAAGPARQRSPSKVMT